MIGFDFGIGARGLLSLLELTESTLFTVNNAARAAGTRSRVNETLSSGVVFHRQPP